MSIDFFSLFINTNIEKKEKSLYVNDDKKMFANNEKEFETLT